MLLCVSAQRDILVEQLDERFHLNREWLPKSMTMPIVMTPTMYDAEIIVKSGLLTSAQLSSARADVVVELQEISRLFRDPNPPTAAAKRQRVQEADSDDSCEDWDNDDAPSDDDPDLVRAKAELALLDSLRAHKYQPKLEGGRKLGDNLCYRGTVKYKRNSYHLAGSDERNLGDYYNAEGDFGLVEFYNDLQETLPLMWILIQKMACVVATEAGAERLFNTAGYTLRPERSLILTSTYENLVRGKCNANVIVLAGQSIVDEYLRLDKEQAWSENDQADDDAFMLFEETIDGSF